MIGKRKSRKTINTRYLAIFFFFIFHIQVSKAQEVIVAFDSSSTVSQQFVTKLKQDLLSLTLYVYDYRDLTKELFLARPDALLVTIGTDAASKAVSLRLPNLTIHTLISKSVLPHLSSQQKLERNVMAIVLDQPVSRLLRFVRLLLGDSTDLSIILGKASRADLNAYKKIAGENDVKLNFSDLSVGKPDQVIRDLISLRHPIIALPDREILDSSNVKLLLYLAYQSRVPIVGFSSSFVSAGALGAVFTTPDLIAKQTVETIINWSKGRQTLFGEVAYPAYFQIQLNFNVAHALKITVEEEISLHEKLNKMESNP